MALDNALMGYSATATDARSLRLLPAVATEEAVVAAEDIKNHQNLNSILELQIRILLIWMTNLFQMTLRKIPLTKLVNYFTVQL